MNSQPSADQRTQPEQEELQQDQMHHQMQQEQRALIQSMPQILDWARQQFSEEEIAAGISEIRKTGGLKLRDFLQELQEAADSK